MSSHHATHENYKSTIGRCSRLLSAQRSHSTEQLSHCWESFLSSPPKHSSSCSSASSSIKDFLRIDSIKEENLKAAMYCSSDLAFESDVESEGSDSGSDMDDEEYEFDLADMDSSSRWLTNEILPVRDLSPYASGSETLSMRHNASSPRRTLDLLPPSPHLSKSLSERLQMELFENRGFVTPEPKLRRLSEIQNSLIREDSFGRIKGNRRKVKTFQNEGMLESTHCQSSSKKRNGLCSSPVCAQGVSWKRPRSIPDLEAEVLLPSSSTFAECA